MNKLYIWNFDCSKETFNASFWAFAKSEREALEQLEKRYPKNFSLIQQYEPDIIQMDGCGSFYAPRPKLTNQEKLELLKEAEC